MNVKGSYRENAFTSKGIIKYLDIEVLGIWIKHVALNTLNTLV
jgi:hypothetical protein